MNPDRDTPATRGDLADLRAELKGDLVDLSTELKGDLVDLRTELHELKAELVELEVRLEERITRSVSIEMGRIANVIMEHTTSQIRAAGDHPKAIEERLDAHIADASLHRRPSRR